MGNVKIPLFKKADLDASIGVFLMDSLRSL